MTIKFVFLSMAVTVALFTTSARAETINCTEIKPPFPFFITVPGIYCLKRNRGFAEANGNFIDIQANDVTIDLNGFKLGGLLAGAGTFANGILASGRKNITIRNGTIRGFFQGVALFSGGGSSGHLVEDLLLDKNRSVGAQVNGSGNVIRNNRVVNTGGNDSDSAFGIVVQNSSDSVVVDNVVSGTSETSLAAGIRVNFSARIEVRGNTFLDAKDATTKRGIEIKSSTDVTVIGNRILNAAGTGTTGVGVPFLSVTSGINCIDNTVAGFATPLDSCDFEAGNNTP